MISQPEIFLIKPHILVPYIPAFKGEGLRNEC
jgi:hypothetical protein